MKKQSIRIYLYADNMVIEGRRLGCCWHVIKAAPYSRMEIHRILLFTYNFWREHRLIVVDPDRPRHFRLDMINQKQSLALNDT